MRRHPSAICLPFAILYVCRLQPACSLTSLGSGNRIAVQQRRSFYELAPWEEKDNRKLLWTDTSKAVVADVFIAQTPDVLPT